VRKRMGTILSEGVNKCFLYFLCGFLWPQFGNLIVTLCTTRSRRVPSYNIFGWYLFEISESWHTLTEKYRLTLLPIGYIFKKYRTFSKWFSSGCTTGSRDFSLRYDVHNRSVGHTMWGNAAESWSWILTQPSATLRKRGFLLQLLCINSLCNALEHCIILSNIRTSRNTVFLGPELLMFHKKYFFRQKLQSFRISVTVHYMKTLD
jgi:hypothetical protein